MQIVGKVLFTLLIVLTLSHTIAVKSLFIGQRERERERERDTVEVGSLVK
jgi:hypothetical protein